MTQRLYERSAHLTTFSAAVVSCTPSKHGYDVVLDQTAFYPEGGGQPGDTGMLGGVRVTDTHAQGDTVVHYCDAPLEPGAAVTGRIDGKRRFDFMQLHSGEHILSGIVHARFGYDNVGFHMGADMVTIDFSGPLSPDELQGVERAANEVVWQNLPVAVTYPDEESLKTIPYRSKKELTGRVRIVTIPGVDICACCGTHVSRTGEIGFIKIFSCQKFHAGVRLEILCGRRAYEYANTLIEQNRRCSTLLSARAYETAAAVERTLSELGALKLRAAQLESQVFAAKAEQLSGMANVLLFEEGLTPDGVRRLADAVMARCGGRCAVFSGSNEAGYQYAVGQPGGDLRDFTKRMNAALDGRGGGRPFFVQGSVRAPRAEIERFFEEED